METPKITGAGAWRAGGVVQYLRDPLILHLYGDDAGAVISNRIEASFGMNYDFKRWLSGRVVLPMAYQTGSDLPDFAADGFGLADMRLGMRAGLPAGKIFHPGVRLDMDVPTGRKDAYLGETGVRITGALLASVDAGPVEVIADLGFTGRKEVDTPADFTLGSELVANGGVMLHIWPEKLAFGTAVYSRGGAKDLFNGGAENAAEIFSDLQFRFHRDLQLDVGAGRGLADGYGSTGFRTLVSLTYIHVPPPPPPEIAPVVTVTENIKPPPPPDIEEPTDKPWEEGQLARVSGLQIEIHDPILFEFGTNIIRPVSYPTLQAVSAIMKAYGQIDHMLIEGHASDEGSFEYNYNLSTSRAQAIFNKLIEYGVHPSRMSYRGMGEVVPVAAGESEEALAANRRVNFTIVKLLDPLAPIPKYSPTIKVPWTGEDIAAPQPGSGAIGSGPAPGVPQKPVQSKEKVQEDFFNTKTEDGDDDWPLPTAGDKKDDGTKTDDTKDEKKEDDKDKEGGK